VVRCCRRATRFARGWGSCAADALYRLILILSRPVVGRLCRLRVRGLEHVLERGGFVVAAYHTSNGRSLAARGRPLVAFAALHGEVQRRGSRPLEEIGREDVQQCGGKGANLGELTRLGLRVPPGFCVVADALPDLLEANALVARVAGIAGTLPYEDANRLEAETGQIRSLISSAQIPTDLETAILDRYRTLVGDQTRYVAVRSSVAVRDSPVSSFPGLMETYHYVLGEAEALAKVRECWASLWTARAAFVRHQQGIAHDRALIAPIVQVMIDADTAGVLFTANPVTGATDEIIVESNWGIGESVVSGMAVADYYVLDKGTLGTKSSRIPKKDVMVTIDPVRGAGRAVRDVPGELADRRTLSEAQLAELGAAGQEIARHFGFEADVEWAYQNGELYILQARRMR
jgi:pyruvate,water dikinase